MEFAFFYFFFYLANDVEVEICKTCVFMFVVLILMKTLFCEENLSNTQQNLICKLQFIIGLHNKKKLVWFSFFVFRHLNKVWKSNFDIKNPQNPILTFAMSRKILFWHSKFYFDIRTE